MTSFYLKAMGVICRQTSTIPGLVSRLWIWSRSLVKMKIRIVSNLESAISWLLQ